MAARLPAQEGANPALPVPASVQCQTYTGCPRPEEVTDQEFEWMEQRRPLIASPEGLESDYGREEAKAMEAAFSAAGLAHLMAALSWPGVGTRWRDFLAWCRAAEPVNARDAFRGYGRALGRVTTYRALALDEKGLRDIFAADCIFPSGQLRVGAEELAKVVQSKGVRTVCVARLFISELPRLLGCDPSISLHDDWQTTCLIASGYASRNLGDAARSRRVRLFELSVPKVESIGWTLQEVALQRSAVLGGDGGHEPWFLFAAPARKEGIWFDGRLQRTERYGLYGVPFLSMRLLRLWAFADAAEVGGAVQAFAEEQAKRHSAGD